MTPSPARRAGPLWWASLLVLLCAYAALATGYRLATPIGEAPDEAGHIAYVSFLRTHGRPPRHGEVGEPLKQQVKHPPLYYALAALAAGGLHDDGLLIFPNPQFSPSNARANVYTASRHTQAERPPMAERYAFVAAMRRLSTLLGLITVLATVLLARTVLPGQDALAIAAGAVVAFLPQFLFMSGVVNNDALATAAGSCALLAAARVAVRPPRDRDHVWLGIALGIGLLAKLTTISMVAVAAIAIVMAARRARSWRVLVRAGTLCGGTLVAIAGAWLVWNTLHGGDVLGWTGFESAAVESLRRTPLLPDLPRFFRLQFESFFGRFGWMIVPLPGWMYAAYGALLAAATAGLAALAARHGLRQAVARRDRAADDGVAADDAATDRVATDNAATDDVAADDVAADDAVLTRLAADRGPSGILLLVAACALVYASAFRLAFAFDLVVAQGRYLFAALGAFGVLIVLGLTWWLPRPIRATGQMALAVGSFALGLHALTAVLQPAFGPVMGRDEAGYASVDPTAVTAARAECHGNCPDFGPGFVRLVIDPCADVERMASGAAAAWQLRWRTTGQQPQDGLVQFAQLVDFDGRVLAQIDRLPLDGRYPSSAWLPDKRFVETISFDVPPVDAPRLASLVVGWYADGRPTERVPVADAAANAPPCAAERHGGVVPSGDGYAWPVVLLPARPIAISSEAAVRGDTFAAGSGPSARLTGVLARPGAVDAAPPSSSAPGDRRALALTLFWTPTSLTSPQAAADESSPALAGARDTVFVHLTAPDGRLAATADGPPAGGRFPTSLWRSGDVVPDEHSLDLADLPSGRYRLSVGWYDAATGVRRAARGADDVLWADGEAVVGTVVVEGERVRFER
ncbi:MAG: DUF2142 domain-containing protein [Ardenticatenales bacterium]